MDVCLFHAGQARTRSEPGRHTENLSSRECKFRHALTGITDERGVRYATYEYDTEGRATASYHADNADRIDISYNDTDGTRTVTNSREKSSTYSTMTQIGVSLVTDIAGPGCSTCGIGNTGYGYDAANNLLYKTENGLVIKYGNYDSNGNYQCKVEGVTQADPTPIDSGICDFDPVASPDARRVDYTYDARFHSRVTTMTGPSVYPGGNKVTTYSYDDYGNRTTVTINGFKPDGTPVSRITTMQYNGPLQQLSFIDGPRTDVDDYTWYDYYPNVAGEGNHRARLKSVTDATGTRLRDAITYTATGKVQSEQRPNGLSLDYDYYPGNDRLETLTQTAGGQSRVTRFTYLATGELETLTQAHGTADATPLTFGYDDARRLTRITDGLGNYTQYVLDTEGNRLQENVHDAQDNLKKQLLQTFDDFNRLDTSSLVDAGSQIMESRDPNYAPDGTLDTQVDGRNSTTDYGYDELRRLTTMVENLGGTDADPDANDASTGYDYDVADRLTTVTDPEGNITTYAYDDLGNQLSVDSPDTGLSTFQYDEAGNLLHKTDAKGQVFNYQYDELNRLLQVTTSNAADDVTYRYDDCANGQGRLCSVSNPSATVHYTYNGFGELARHQGITSSHDAAGLLQTLTYPSGAVVTYAYDGTGQIERVDFSHQGATRTLADSIRYLPFGPMTALTYGNALQLNQGYDDAYHMASQSIPGIGLAHGYPSYDGNGNLETRNLSVVE